VNQKSPFFVKWVQYYTGSYNPLKCNFFNSYMLKKNGHSLGTYCALFSQKYEAGEASYVADGREAITGVLRVRGVTRLMSSMKGTLPLGSRWLSKGRRIIW
jgi:hypothetical protein